MKWGDFHSIWATEGVPRSLWRTSVILKSPVVSHLAPSSNCSVIGLVLQQAAHCVCSAEQAAMKALCVCVFVPASLSDCVNPCAALVTLHAPRQLRLAHFSFSGFWLAFPAVCHCVVVSLLANHIKGNPLLTSQDQTAIRQQCVWLATGYRGALQRINGGKTEKGRLLGWPPYWWSSKKCMLWSILSLNRCVFSFFFLGLITILFEEII